MTSDINPIEDDDYTVGELLAMGEEEFRQAVTEDMHYTRRFNGPFQDREVIARTMHALIDSLHWVNSQIDDRIEDPNCPAEVLQKTRRYRSHLLSTIDMTERRMGWMQGTKERTLRKWRAVLDEVVTGILAGHDDDEILAIQIPSFRDADGDESERYSLETWHEIRRAKDPARYERMLEAAA